MSIPTNSVAPVPPTGTSNPWSLVQWWKRICDWIAALSPSGASEYDTGWMDITPSGGRTGLFRIRRAGSLVCIVSNGISGNFAVGHTVVGTLPPDLLPPTNVRGACWLGGNYDGTAYAATNGDIGVFHQSGGTRTGCSFTITYFLA